jgi:hypothetical protein
MNRSILALALAQSIAASCFGQLYNFNGSYQYGSTPSGQPVDGAYSGTVNIDAGNHTLSATGSGVIPALNWSQSANQTVTIPGQFPNPTKFYSDTLSVHYSSPQENYSLNLASQVPRAIGIDEYTVGHFQPIPEITVSFSYTLTENGVTISTGSGTYPVSGSFSQLAVNTSSYPTNVGIVLFAPTFAADTSVPIINVTAPHGHFVVGGVPLAVVPEPSEYAFVFGLASLTAGMCLRKRSKLQPTQ